MKWLHALGHALAVSGTMTWAILWALILGFGLSAVVQALVSRQTVVRLLGADRPRTLAVAAGLGAASSSCSYAAVALARSLFSKGASFTAGKPGTYQYLCPVPGHAKDGMAGTFAVVT